jgi:hypothetical protein
MPSVNHVFAVDTLPFYTFVWMLISLETLNFLSGDSNSGAHISFFEKMFIPALWVILENTMHGCSFNYNTKKRLQFAYLQ